VHFDSKTESKRAAYRKWRLSHPEKDKANNRRCALRKYGLTPKSFDDLLKSQSGCCAICRTDQPNGPGKKLMVDHCHSTNIVRGLLCCNCNFLIGHSKEDASILHAAAKYLERRAA